MKFILIVEENGYDLRYWDEIEEEVGDSILTSWDVDFFYKELKVMNFNITKDVLKKAIALIEEDVKPFVILSSKTQEGHLDTLHEDVFIIED